LTFTGTLPFLYRFSFLTAKVLADGNHLPTVTKDGAARRPYHSLPFFTDFYRFLPVSSF
jgi:hypothetical protein